MNIKSGMITFIYVIWFEVVLNAFPILEEADGYKLVHIDVFYSEKVKDHNVEEELFVKQSCIIQDLLKDDLIALGKYRI